MKNKNESSVSLASLTAVGTAVFALALFSACNNSSSTRVGTGTNPAPTDTACPAWGCGNPPIIIVTFTPTPTPTFTIDPVHPIGTGPYPTPTPVGPEPCIDCSIGVAATDSVDTDTKDVDLQRAEVQQQNLDDRASAIAQQFGMSFDSAHQLAVLADRVQTLNAQGAVSQEDEQAVIQTRARHRRTFSRRSLFGSRSKACKATTAPRMT